MGLRAALRLSAAALEFCRDKDLPQREILNYRKIPPIRAINMIRAETKFHFKCKRWTKFRRIESRNVCRYRILRREIL
jgi:hypothetical protein